MNTTQTDQDRNIRHAYNELQMMGTTKYNTIKELAPLFALTADEIRESLARTEWAA